MWFSVDPGVGGTGVAIWSRRNVLQRVETIHAGKSKDWPSRAHSICFHFDVLLKYWRPALVVLEGPQFFGGGGRVVAESGDLVKLAMLAGALMSQSQFIHAEIQLVSPSQWKGQLPKSVCAARIERAMGEMWPKKRMSNHAVDAIGIGLWSQGKF